jgi:hypothetical protein
VPAKLSRKEKDLLEQFAAVHKDSPRDGFDEYLETSKPGPQAEAS